MRFFRMYFSYFTLFATSLVVIHAQAAQVTTEPVVQYTLVGGQQQTYSDIGSLISNLNSAQSMKFDNCKSSPNHLGGYGCTMATITGSYPSPAYNTTYNGKPIYYTLERTQTSESKQSATAPVQSSSGPTGSLGVSVSFNCPKTFSAVVTGASPSFTMECTKIEPDSCAATGNPINLGTGDKFEWAVDFSTADGVLRIERNYISQFKGWKIDTISQIDDVPANGFSSGSSGYGVDSTRNRHSLDPIDPTSFITYQHHQSVRFWNRTTSRRVYFTAGGGRRAGGAKLHRFVENNGNLVADGPDGSKIQLVQLNPQGANGEAWKFTSSAGDVSYMSSSGKLMRVEFGTGGSVSYSYSNNKLTTKTDHLGRSLTYFYDLDDRLVSITLPDATSIVYEYGSDKNSAEYYLLKKVTWPNGESIGYIYNETGYVSGSNITQKMLTGKLDAYGNRVGNYQYENGKAVSTEGALGSNKKLLDYFSTYTDVTDGLGSKRKYTFATTLSDGTKLLTATNQPAGSGCAAATESVTYYTEGLKKTETNFNGHKTQFEYDTTRSLETVRVEGVPKGNNTNYLPANTTLVAGARKITTLWHTQHRKPVKKSEPRLITTFIYNGDADPFNNNQTANCAPTSLPLLCHKVKQATTDVNGASGLNASLDNTLSARHEFYTYNARGQQLTFSRTAIGTPNDTREYYESTTSDWTLGDLKKLTNALGHEIQFNRYDRNGRLLEMIDANGVEAEFTYDIRGRVLTQTLAGATTTHSYDLNGNRISSTLPNGVIYTYHYDLAKRLVAVENTLGEKINYEYDVENNLRFERITDSGSTQTYVKQHVYDALSRVQNTLNSNNQGSTYLYDAKGNLTGETDANTNSTTATIDPLDQLTRVTDALNGKTDLSYDAQGNLTQVKDARNNITTYTYNAFGDLVSQASPDTGTTTFTYDAAGNRTSSTDARGVVVNYTYDALNRLTSVQYPAASSENITYTYDSVANGNYGVGRLTGVQTSAVQVDFEYNYQGLITKKYVQVANTSSTTEYSYDLAGNLTGVVYPSGREINYQLDSLGRISGITTKANSSASSQTLVSNIGYLPFGPANAYTYGNGLSHSQAYDQDYRLTGITVGGILSRTYGYDPVSNITSIVNGLNAGNNQTFTYDALNRLITAAGGYGALGYTYDAVGNRLTETRNSVTDTYTYSSTSNKLNTITRASGNRTFAYDAAGNPAQRTADDNSNQTFNFNNANRLNDVSVNGSLAATYTYNPLGQRVVKTLPNSSKEIYHYDESGQLIAVTDGAGVAMREYIYWGNQQIALIINGDLYYIHNDHLNTPQVVTNQSQQVVWMGDYEPFGKLAANQSNSIELYSRFPGQYLDPETNLYYNYFRDYDPSIGRYIESDPIGLEGGINTYAYVEGNPATSIDPFGLNKLYPRHLFPVPLFPGYQPFDFTNPYNHPNSPYDPSPNEASSGDTGYANACPPRPGNQDPCKGLRRELGNHIAKLQQYIADPLSMDNQGFLAAAFNSGNSARAQQIINNRMRALQKQIDNFKRLLAECEARNGK